MIIIMHTIFLANLGSGKSHNRLVLGSIVALVVLSEVTELMLLLLWAAINLVHVSLVCLNMLNFIFKNYYEKVYPSWLEKECTVMIYKSWNRHAPNYYLFHDCNRTTERICKVLVYLYKDFYHTIKTDRIVYEDTTAVLTHL